VRPYGNGRRVFYGLLWTGWTAVFVIGGLGVLFGGQILAGVAGLVIGGFTGRYAYRIWTWRARRLVFSSSGNAAPGGKPASGVSHGST